MTLSLLFAFGNAMLVLAWSHFQKTSKTLSLIVSVFGLFVVVSWKTLGSSWNENLRLILPGSPGQQHGNHSRFGFDRASFSRKEPSSRVSRWCWLFSVALLYLCLRWYFIWERMCIVWYTIVWVNVLRTLQTLTLLIRGYLSIFAAFLMT